MLLSRYLLNVSPTQMFRQSQEERNLSGAFLVQIKGIN